MELFTKYGWSVSNGESHNWPVGVKLPNALGVFDMHGNVWEWCHDLWSSPGRRYSVELKGPEEHSFRGGSFGNPTSYCRSAHRNGQRSVQAFTGGFRLSRTYHLPLLPLTRRRRVEI